MKRECETCIKRKTPYCPTSIDCMATDDMPYYQNIIMLLEENQELNKQVEVSNELVAQGTLTEMKLHNEVNRWRKEYQDTYKDVRIEIKEYKTQQKEFIKYLEDEINKLVKEYGNYVYDDYSMESEQCQTIINTENLV